MPRLLHHCRVALGLALVLLTAAWPRLEAATARKARGGAESWWHEIDTGPFLAETILEAPNGAVAALKGLAVKVGPAGEASLVFDTELLAWRAGFEGGLVLDGTPWSGSHGGNSHYPPGGDKLFFQHPSGRGAALGKAWSDPRTGRNGPLPLALGRYRGLYRHGREVVVHYTVGGIDVLELPGYEQAGGVAAVTRTIAWGATAPDELAFVVQSQPAGRVKSAARVYLVGGGAGVALRTEADGRTVLAVARGTPAGRCKLVYAGQATDPAKFAPPADVAALTRGGPALFPRTFEVAGEVEAPAPGKAYAVDAIPLPAENPWKSPPRFGGFDFFPDGKRLAACTWNGDVWIAEGIDGDLSRVSWRRFASGLFQTLGLKIVDGVIYTQGRDQITRLRDLNGDGEADHYECFNNDVLITAGFHEFSFDLETDRQGNFYFSKAMPVNQGGRGFMPWTPHNGAVLKVSPDGSKLERVAWGLRAPGGVGVSPEGVVTTGENEGSWVPVCKITWTPPGRTTFNGVVPSTWGERGVFGGVLPGAPADYDRPLCWIPYAVDNSSGSQAWVPPGTTWDPRHAGEMLHLSYGKSGIFRVLREEVDGVVQGGVYRLPIEVGAAVMRARFHPVNGQLYVAGFRGWQTNGRDALQRVRYTGVKTPVPVGLEARRNGLLVRFSAPLDPKSAEDPARYSISKWNYVWGPQYGSGRFSIDQRDAKAEELALTVPSKGAHNVIDAVPVGAARVLEDGRSVFLYLPRMTPAMQMELKLDLTDARGAPVRETIYHTVHRLGAEFTLAGVRWDQLTAAPQAPAGEPGLALSFNAEITDTLRVDRLALTVPAGASPSVFITPRGGAFGAAFQGSLVAAERDDYTFALDGVGQASLLIDGQTIVSGDLPLTAKVPVTLAKGAHAIYCSYRSRPSGEARIRLLWSSPSFRWEPVPAAAFRHLPGTEMQAWSRARAGREVLAAAQCVRCHAPRGGNTSELAPELRFAPPDLADAGQRFQRDWLERWISAPQRRCPTVAPERAADIASYLASQKGKSASPMAIPSDPASVAAGSERAQTLHLGPWLEALARDRRHTDAGLVALLREPARHDRDTVFPDLRLTPQESLQIAAYVRSRQPAAERPSGRAGDVSVGATAYATACAACHGGATPTAAAPSLEDIVRADWAVKGCVSPRPGRAPDLRLTAEDKSVLLAFRNADRDVGVQSLRRFAPHEYAAGQLRALRCQECHAAGGENKLPDITLAGAKFEQAWLEKLFAGQAGRLRPWQEARMPAFASRAAHLAVGLASQHGVPPAGPKAEAGASLVEVGGKLAGEGGYSCVACHDSGPRPALQVFEGQGPNLQLAGQRLRYDYYQRWMHWPQRIAPSTIMPRYTKDRDRAQLASPFDGRAEQQFGAIWAWMRALEPAP